MYLVTIINDDTSIVINEVSTANDAARITGKIKQGINCINSFTFQIYQNNPGYGMIEPYKTRITAYNTKKGKYEFIGRAITPGKVMDSSGLCYNEFVCEDVKGYLCDSRQMYGEYHDITPANYLRTVIDYHNQRVSGDKQFVVRNVTVTDNNDSIYRYTSYDSTYNNISSDLVDKLGGEIWIETDMATGINYIDYLRDYGAHVETPIKIGHNMQSCHQKPDFSSFATRVIPLGCKKVGEDGKETDERLTIESVNNGRNYVQDDALVAEYGVIEVQIIWDDVTDAENLKTKAQNYLNSLKIPVSNTITALDLSLIGLDSDSFEVGNYYPLYNPLLGIDEYARIIEKVIVIENPSENTFVFGEREVDAIRLQAEKEKNTNMAIKIAAETAKTAQKTAVTAQGAADTAQQAAETAQQTADEAKEITAAQAEKYDIKINELEEMISGITPENDYEKLKNKPQIEGVTLVGDKTYEELNLRCITNTELEELLTI